MSLDNLNNKHILWIMGPTSSGKTTIANQIIINQREKGLLYIQYDGDEIRDCFGSGIRFEKSERLRVVRTIVHLANKSREAGMNVVVSALTANEDARLFIKDNVHNLVIVYLDCSINQCIKRDPKGLYKKAISGEIETLIGYNSEYLPPKNPDIIVNTEKQTLEQCVNIIINEINDL
jgi:adenylylsulfate kinase